MADPNATGSRAATLEELLATAIQPMLNEYPQPEGNTLCRVSGARKVGDSGKLIARRVIAIIAKEMA